MINRPMAKKNNSKSITPRTRDFSQPKKPVVPKFNGDHGTTTKLARTGTVLEPMENDNGKNPNNVFRRRRTEAIENFTLSMRQGQAAKAVRNAYCRREMLTSGGPLKEKVQTSSRPDASVATLLEAQAQLDLCMAAVPRDFKAVVEHICWHNLPAYTLKPGTETMHRAMFKVAMDLVANKLRF